MYLMEVFEVFRGNPSLVDGIEKSNALELGRGRLLMSRKARVPRIMCKAGTDKAQASLALKRAELPVTRRVRLLVPRVDSRMSL